MLTSGVVWGVWYVPLGVWAGYATGPSPLLSAVLFVVATAALSSVLAHMRLETGSICSPRRLRATR